LFAAGCLVLTGGAGAVAGYALSHPWRLWQIPALDQFLAELPANADCLFVHDIALAPEARGHARGLAVLRRLETLARAHRFQAMAMVSVYGTRPLWQRLGFQATTGHEVARQLGDYGPGAEYMVKRLV